MERNISHETQSLDVLRTEDLKRFWPGFITFRSNNSEFEAATDTAVITALRENNLRESRSTAVNEAIMLFYYGIHLARKLHPQFVGELLPPDFRIDTKQKHKAFYVGVSYDGKNKVQTRYGIGLDFIVNPDLWYFPHINLESSAFAKSVSENHLDWVVVSIVTAGAEEYAHSVFSEKKPIHHTLKAVKEYERVSYKNRTAKENIGTASVKYHLREIERRGLIWRQRLTRKYFPNWADRTIALNETVSAIRYKKATNPARLAVMRGKSALKGLLNIGEKK